jgi:DNA-directed RNA polymerase subunit K/omega
MPPRTRKDAPKNQSKLDTFFVRQTPATAATDAAKPTICAVPFQSIIVDKKTPTAQISRRTLPILTKYERANAIGTRARQIGMNYPVFVNVSGMEDEVEMARKELLAGKCPLIVRRVFPDHTIAIPHFEDWFVSELSIF